jgi:hypothetical protein
MSDEIRPNDEVTLHRQLTREEAMEFLKAHSDAISGGSNPVTPMFCNYCAKTFIGMKVVKCSYSSDGTSITTHCTYK